MCRSLNKLLTQTQTQVAVQLGMWIEAQYTIGAEGGFEEAPGAFLVENK